LKHEGRVAYSGIGERCRRKDREGCVMERRMSERRGKGLNEWMWNAEEQNAQTAKASF